MSTDIISKASDSDDDELSITALALQAREWRSYEERVASLGRRLKIGPDESAAARFAFHDFCLLGFNRSLQKLLEIYKERSNEGAEVPTLAIKTLRHWQTRYDWQRRAGEFDLEVLKQEETNWLERRRKLQEMNWQVGEQLRSLANEMLAVAPKFIKQKQQLVPGTNGEPDKLIITLAMKEDVLFKSVQMAADLQQRAVDGGEIGVNKGRALSVKTDGKGAVQVVAVDYNKAISILAPHSEDEDDDGEK